MGERDNRMKAQIDYFKAKEALRLISGDVARLDDDFVQLMLQSKYGAGKERLRTTRNTDGTVSQNFTKPYVTDEIRLAFRTARALNVPARIFLWRRPWGWDFVRNRVFVLAPSANPLATLEYLRSFLYTMVPSKRLSGKTL